MAKSGPNGHRAPSQPRHRRVLKQLSKLGWTIVDVNSGWLCKHPNGTDAVTIHCTASESGWRMTQQQFKRLGVKV